MSNLTLCNYCHSTIDLDIGTGTEISTGIFICAECIKKYSVLFQYLKDKK